MTGHRIAFIGLGAIGMPMAMRLAQHTDIVLTFFDAHPGTREKVSAIGRVAGSVADAVEGADSIFTVLPADSNLESVVADVKQVARPGQTLVDFSTIAPATIDKAATELAEYGVQTVSVTITRSTAAARRGELALFVGGVDRLPSGVDVAFQALATDVIFVGERSAAKALKLINNMVISCTDIAICEALVLGRLYGIGDEELTTALADSEGDSWALRNHIISHVLPDDLGPGRFSTRYMAKDMGICLKMAESHAFGAPLVAAACAFYRGTTAIGLGEHFHMAVIRWIEHIFGHAGSADAGRVDSLMLDPLSRAVAAIQRLVTHDALELAESVGIQRRMAMQYLANGSANNAYLRRLLENGLSEPDWSEETQKLESLIELASARQFPALFAQIGQQATFKRAMSTLPVQ